MAGRPVRRPLAAEYRCEPVIDAEEPCPACGAVAYAEYFPTEQWRGGRVGPGGVTTPNPVVVCLECGHEARDGSFFGASVSDEGEDEAERQTRIARAQAEARVQQWHGTTMLLRGVTFPMRPSMRPTGGRRELAAADRAVTCSRRSPSLTRRHRAWTTMQALCTGLRSPRPPTTFSSPASFDRARETLEVWAGNQQPQMSWEERSHAAITLWLAAHQRRSRGLVIGAERTQQPNPRRRPPAVSHPHHFQRQLDCRPQPPRPDDHDRRPPPGSQRARPRTDRRPNRSTDRPTPTGPLNATSRLPLRREEEK